MYDTTEELNTLQTAMLEKNIIFLDSHIDSEMARYVLLARMILDVKGSPDIEIRIASNGGDTRAGLDIYDILKTYAGNTTGIVMGRAQSMAAVILQACNERKCFQHAVLLIHNPCLTSTHWSHYFNDAKRTEMQNILIRARDQMYGVLMEKTGKTFQEIEEKCNKDTNMTAEEALTFGLIDEIV